MEIHVIIPVLRNRIFEETTRKALEPFLSDNVELVVDSLDRGTASIETEFDEELAGTWVLDKVRKAEERGADAVVIDCMGDIALSAARETVSIPVIGPFQASLAIASVLGERFTLITGLKQAIPLFWRAARGYGFEHQMASIRSVEFRVLDTLENEERIRQALLSEAEIAVREDDAQVIILGCGLYVGLGSEIRERLNVPVIDPVVVSLKLAELLVASGLSHSKKAYPSPLPKRRIIPDAPALCTS